MTLCQHSPCTQFGHQSAAGKFKAGAHNPGKFAQDKGH